MDTPERSTIKMLTTPSPTASGTASSTNTAPSSASTPASQSRRPPRKSTLTQQQKNQKRQRATQDQLVLLEVEFNKNPTPTAAVRERIAQEINMTERSVQIWFQNRRAKIKLLAKKSIENGEDCDGIPESYRQYLAHQAMEQGKPLSRNFMTPGMMGFEAQVLLGPGSQGQQKVVIHHFECRSLSIGSWRRVGQNAMDLVIFYSLGQTPCLTYYINNDAAGYKIEFPFSYIKNITLESGHSENGVPTRPAGLVVELNRSPNFFMDANGQGSFTQCGDFTEDQQASQVLLHHLGGDPRVLSGQLAKLTLVDSFQNRHNPYADSCAVAASAPVSPIYRPSSQPSSMPPPPFNMFPDNGFGMPMHSAHQIPRGHKRQRSRSVPNITDFSYLQHPMPSFHVHHPSTDASMFAPMPQHSNGLTPAGHSLRIDTTSAFGSDYRQYPLSAATTASVSDFASPSLMHAQMDPAASNNLTAGYSFLHSPMLEHAHTIQPSASPLSALSLSHGDPVIANQSPPLSNFPRSASADFLSMSSHHTSFSDDGLILSDMYSKQTMNLPFRSAGFDDSALDMQLQEDPNSDELDMHSMINFGTIDPAALSPDHSVM